MESKIEILTCLEVFVRDFLLAGTNDVGEMLSPIWKRLTRRSSIRYSKQPLAQPNLQMNQRYKNKKTSYD